MSAEKKILIILAVGLVCLEVGTRVVEPYLSKDLAHIRTFSDLSERLAPPLAESGDRGSVVLVLGNSLARFGIDEEILRAGLKGAEGQLPAMGFMTADGSGIAEWAWGYRRYVLNSGARPDLVILVTGRLHLVDPLPQNLLIQYLGAFFVDARDRRKFISENPVGAEKRLDFLLATQSRLAVDRARLRPLLFYRTVPGYEIAVNQINEALGGGVAGVSLDNDSTDTMSGNPQEGQTDALNLLIDSVRESGSRLVVVTAPLPDAYSLPEVVAANLEARDVTLVPLGKTLRLPSERFPDGYHLDETGAQEFTKLLLERAN